MKISKELQYLNIIAQTDIHKTLQNAACDGDLSLLKFCVEHDGNINHLGFEPLFHAILYNQVDIAKYLIEQGALICATYDSKKAIINLLSFKEKYFSDEMRVLIKEKLNL